MSDKGVSRKALLELISFEANRDGGDFERWTILAGKIISGDLDLTESEGECNESNLCPECTKVSRDGWKQIAEEAEADNERLRNETVTRALFDVQGDELRRTKQENERLLFELAESDGWGEYWRREAFRKYPTPLREENERLKGEKT